MQALSKSAISEGAAKWWIYGAVAMGVLSGLMTVLAVSKGLLGASLFNLVDAGICFGLAYGVYRRSLLCAWAQLGLYVVNRITVFASTGRPPTSRAITFLLFYSMAIVCIGLYPRIGRPVAQSDTGDISQSTGGDRVV